jgi:hypothetical protein
LRSACASLVAYLLLPLTCDAAALCSVEQAIKQNLTAPDRVGVELMARAKYDAEAVLSRTFLHPVLVRGNANTPSLRLASAQMPDDAAAVDARPPAAAPAAPTGRPLLVPTPATATEEEKRAASLRMVEDMMTLRRALSGPNAAPDAAPPEAATPPAPAAPTR